MKLAPTVLARTLARARAEWLSGDPDAWERYTAGLAQLEEHYRHREESAGAERDGTRRAAPARPGDRPAARF